jgi:hypothetical protein
MRKAFTGVTLVATVMNLGLPELAAAQGPQAPERPLLAAALATASRTPFQESGGAQLPEAWMGLEALPIGTRLRITVADGSAFEGELVAATADGVTLQHNRLLKGQYRAAAGASLDDALTFQRADVSSVRLIRNGREVDLRDVNRAPGSYPSRHPVLTGLLIGAAAGAVFGMVVTDCSEFGPGACPYQLIGAGLLGGIGAGIGALVGLGLSSR